MVCFALENNLFCIYLYLIDTHLYMSMSTFVYKQISWFFAYSCSFTDQLRTVMLLAEKELFVNRAFQSLLCKEKQLDIHSKYSDRYFSKQKSQKVGFFFTKIFIFFLNFQKFVLLW